MGSIYLKLWPSEFEVSFMQDTGLSETYVKPVVMNTYGTKRSFPTGFVELVQVPLLVFVNLYCLRMTLLVRNGQ